MDYVNRVVLKNVTTNTTDPFTVTFLGLPDSDTSIVSAKRFVVDNDITSVDISGNVTISGQIATCTSIWGSETKVPGRFRVQIVAKADDNSIVQEINVMVTIPY